LQFVAAAHTAHAQPPPTFRHVLERPPAGIQLIIVMTKLIKTHPIWCCGWGHIEKYIYALRSVR